MTQDELTAQFFDELKNEDGLVPPENITDTWLEQLRKRIKAGELPEVIETDYRRGWLLYARADLIQRFVRHRANVNGNRIRGIFPLLREHGNGAATWAMAEDRAEESAIYAEARLEAHANQAVWLYGSQLVSSGKATWDQVRQMMHGYTDAAVNEAIGSSEDVKGAAA